jgi:uncharacterized membrane-anchored protein
MLDSTLAPERQNAGGPALVDRTIHWLKGRERNALIVAAALQILVLLAMIVARAAPLVFGETVLLRVVPVDPRDLFRGDYVILSYEFTRVPPTGIEGLPLMALQQRGEFQGRTVYVWLSPAADGRHMESTKCSIYPPPSGKYLRGTLADWGRLEFGIESYYVQEGKGRAYEQAMRNRRLSAEVALSADGTATLRGLRIE